MLDERSIKARNRLAEYLRSSASTTFLEYAIPGFLEGSGTVGFLFNFAARFETGRGMKIDEALFLHDSMYATRHRMAFPVSEAG